MWIAEVSKVEGKTDKLHSTERPPGLIMYMQCRSRK
jgi:hypothetical protein